MMINKEGLVEVTRKHLENKGDLLFLALSGSHIWGLSRPDSDYDVRGVYSDTLLNIFTLREVRDTVEFKDTLDGVEVDGQLYELRKFLRMLSKGNGNMITMVKSPVRLYEDKLTNWGKLADMALSKDLYHYYKGYAHSQRKRALSQRGGKALLYTFREIFSGLFLMRYGYMEFDFNKLWNIAVSNGWYKGAMLARYWPNYKVDISETQWNEFFIEWEQLVEELRKEKDTSKLPEHANLFDTCACILLVQRYNLAVRYSQGGGISHD